MRTMHLFAGAGGGLLADLILGHQPVVAVEWDAYACAVLRERRDEGWFPGLHVHEGDIRLFDPSEWKGRVDCIHAGFPCQDISAAGKGAGITGSRSGLFSEVMRAVDAVRPPFVFLENSPLIITRGLDHVLRSPAERGYDAVWTILAAADVGAPHLRKRWWCLCWDAAHTNREGKLQPEGAFATKWGWSDNSASEDVPNSVCQGRKDSSRRATAKKSPVVRRSSDMESCERATECVAPWFEAQPDVGVLVHGLADGLVPDAIKCLGNGQVPLCAAVALKMLWEEMSRETGNTEKAD